VLFRQHLLLAHSSNSLAGGGCGAFAQQMEWTVSVSGHARRFYQTYICTSAAIMIHDRGVCTRARRQIDRHRAFAACSFEVATRFRQNGTRPVTIEGHEGGIFVEKKGKKLPPPTPSAPISVAFPSGSRANIRKSLHGLGTRGLRRFCARSDAKWSAMPSSADKLESPSTMEEQNITNVRASWWGSEPSCQCVSI
jgi:hypothetical protein